MNIAANIVAKAVSHYGEREIGATNTGPQVDTYLAYVGLAPGNPWCAAFASYTVGQTCKEMGAPSTFPRTGSSSQIYLWGRSNARLTEDPLPGDIALEKGGPTGHQHTLLVLAAGGNWVVCISGNDGNAVAVDVRAKATLDFVRPY